MGYFKTNWRRAGLLLGGWTLVSVIFAAISYAAAIGENNKEFGFVSALRLNLVQFYLWAISHRFFLNSVVAFQSNSVLSIFATCCYISQR